MSFRYIDCVGLLLLLLYTPEYAAVLLVRHTTFIWYVLASDSRFCDATRLWIGFKGLVVRTTRQGDIGLHTVDGEKMPADVSRVIYKFTTTFWILFHLREYESPTT